MKLSEAIRLGAMMKPQAFGDYFSPMKDASCAFGAAYDAIGVSHWTTSESVHFPIVTEMIADPVTGGASTVLSAVLCLNDDLRWTRERIADWVETIEAQQEQAKPELELVTVDQ